MRARRRRQGGAELACALRAERPLCAATPPPPLPRFAPQGVQASRNRRSASDAASSTGGGDVGDNGEDSATVASRHVQFVSDVGIRRLTAEAGGVATLELLAPARPGDGGIIGMAPLAGPAGDAYLKAASSSPAQDSDLRT